MRSGSRLSVGAHALDVLMQFLVEAVVLSLAGGAIGVALGIAAAYGISSVMQWSTVVTPAAGLLSFGCAAAIGIFFGFYPAPEGCSARSDPTRCDSSSGPAHGRSGVSPSGRCQGGAQCSTGCR